MRKAAASYSCFTITFPNRSRRRLVKLVSWDGPTSLLAAKKQLLAGELMSEFPDRIVCHANSFYIGHPLPVLAAAAELLAGETYFLLPADRFGCSKTLTTASLASLSPPAAKVSLEEQSPFSYAKGDDGRQVIKVRPEFIAKVIGSTQEENGGRRNRVGDGGGGSSLCSTPELRKHYEQLVGLKCRHWSPTLETITESKHKGRRSCTRLLMSKIIHNLAAST
ncbi:uncharacterized protein LOC122049319 [Zingiber officinale]|uniref:uncharacterized protein LOC122049319 n=1 Tax=Zingiber officinale TaxID=94328 RepID=UPI001C4B6BD8|nr:uncharacterized protein LOC122049319 [Zingiber officinale]